MLDHISLFPQIRQHFGELLPDNLVDLFIFKSPGSESVLFLEIIETDEKDEFNELGLQAQIKGSYLTTDITDLDELKNWFFTLDSEELLYSTDIFLKPKKEGRIPDGYEVIGQYSSEMEYFDPDLMQATVDGTYSNDLKTKYDDFHGRKSSAENYLFELITDWSCCSGHPSTKFEHLEYLDNAFESGFCKIIDSGETVVIVCRDKAKFEKDFQKLDDDSYEN